MTEEDRRSLVGVSIVTEGLEGQIRLVDDSIPQLVDDIVHFKNSARPLIIREESESPAKKKDELVVGKGKGIPYHKSGLITQTENVELNSISNSADLVSKEAISMEIPKVNDKENKFFLLKHVNEEGNEISTKAKSLIDKEEKHQVLEILNDDAEIKSTVIPNSFNIMNITNHSVVYDKDIDEKLDKFEEDIEDGIEISSTPVTARIRTNIKFKLQKELKSLGNVSLPSKLRKGELIKRKGSASFPTSIPK
ncbi:hypothetical protein MA16_Dca002431 [Dendrobium catenatum]|uniref:Uncharacterized protein n=1 Tax=Dendrobium catenatum TaxID=906689 RepID=A0A2I0W0G4_9ASPA|nr:hypothetical protein MA16_Dca002431 [Dendrobium catenatum]